MSGCTGAHLHRRESVGMNGVDIILIVAVAASAAHGFFRGAAVQLLSFGGFWGGLALGAVLAPQVSRHVHSNMAKTTTAIVVVFGLAILLGGVGERIGAKIRSGLRVTMLGPLDAGVGAAIARRGDPPRAIWVITATDLHRQHSFDLPTPQPVGHREGAGQHPPPGARRVRRGRPPARPVGPSSGLRWAGTWSAGSAADAQHAGGPGRGGRCRRVHREDRGPRCGGRTRAARAGWPGRAWS